MELFLPVTDDEVLSAIFSCPVHFAPEYLLLETGDKLLLETGDGLLLESSTPAGGGGPSFNAAWARDSNNLVGQGLL